MSTAAFVVISLVIVAVAAMLHALYDHFNR